MSVQDFVALYNNNEYLYYSHQKEACKQQVCEIIQHLSFDLKQQIIKLFEKHISWKEYDYFIYSQLIKRFENVADISVVTLQLLNALTSNIKEIVIVAMDLMNILGTRIDLNIFMEHYYFLEGQNTPAMSYYAYLIPTIKTIYGITGLQTVQDLSTNLYSNLYKLHALKFNQRITYSEFIKTYTQHLSTYEDTDLISLLFEVICKRREKIIAYESLEIEFILNHLPGIEPPALNYFKYFLSHLCITYNRTHKTNDDVQDKYLMKIFNHIEKLCILLLTEQDTQKVKRGVKIYTDFYNCVIKSQYKTMYTVMKTDFSDCIEIDTEDKTLKIGESPEHLKFIISLIDDTNFHLFVDILTLFDCTEVITKEDVLKFYNNLQDDYLEDKIDGFVKLLLTNWYKGYDNRRSLIEEILPGIINFIEGINYNLYRNIKMICLSDLLNDFSVNEKFQLESAMMEIINFIIDNNYLHLQGHKSKLYERILVSAIDLLVQLSITSLNLNELKLKTTLKYLEKGIFCNKRYAVSAIGQLYKKFITSQFPTHKDLLLNYVLLIIEQESNHFDSNMRRSLEKRQLVHEFCLAVDKKQKNEVALLICNECFLAIGANKNNRHAQQTTLCGLIFVADALMGDASLKSVTNEFVLKYLIFCLEGIDVYSHDFALCNAIYTLYSTLVQRILPYHDNTKNMSLKAFDQQYPGILTRFNITQVSKSNILLSLLLQRTNNESWFVTETHELNHKIFNYFSMSNPLNPSFQSNLCGFDVDSYIKLWLNLSCIENTEKLMETIQNLSCQNHNLISSHTTKNFNFLNVKFKLLQGLAKKFNYLNKQRLLLTNLTQDTLKPVVNNDFVQNFDKKMRVQPPVCLKQFPLKQLTLEQSFITILSEKCTIYEKITTFEFLFEHYALNLNKFDVFVQKFLRLYLVTLFDCVLTTKTTNYKLGNFVMSLNTIVFCLDKINFDSKQLMTTGGCFVNFFDVFDFHLLQVDSNPNLLAFVTVVSVKFSNFIHENCNISRKLLKNYLTICQNIDNLEQDDAESVLCGFKHLKHCVLNCKDKNKLKIDIFLAAMIVLHSLLLTECDYLLVYVLEALDITDSGCYLSASDVRRFALSNDFFVQYFSCKRSRVAAFLKYLHWKRTNN